MSDIDSIKNVQDAEEKAKNLVDHANKVKGEKITEAATEGEAAVMKAEEKAKEMKDAAIKQLVDELAKDRARKLDDAKKRAAKIRKTGLNPAKLKQIVDQSVKQILGA